MDTRDAASRGRKKNSATKRNRYEDAVQAIDEALKIDPKDAAAWISKGIVLIDLGRNEEALQALDASLKLDPEDPLAWTSKAAALINLGRDEEALQAVDTCTSDRPQGRHGLEQQRRRVGRASSIRRRAPGAGSGPGPQFQRQRGLGDHGNIALLTWAGMMRRWKHWTLR